MSKLSDMLDRLRAGLKGTPHERLGPAGEAHEVLARVLTEAKAKGMFDGNVTLKCVDVLMLHNEEQHKGLAVAIDLVNALEDGTDPKLVTRLVEAFKYQAVKARMHQYYPVREIKN